MNTPPTMSTAPLPMAPVKSSRKQVKKLGVKPKKLLYNDQEFEMRSKEEASVIYSVKSLEIQEKIQLSVKSKLEESSDSMSVGKHVEQNELDNESEQVKIEETKVEHSYNLRRRNKTLVYHSRKRVPKKRIVKSEFEEEKENIQGEVSSIYSGISICTNLSQPADHLDIHAKLEWYQVRRDVGLWIQCCNKNCGKWRFVESFHDPVDVPEIWFCSMNLDKGYSSCEDPVQESYYLYKKDLIRNVFNAGSLVWARVNGYPWWPGIIDDCPETLRYYQLEGRSRIPISYHVTFFEEKPSRAWLAPKSIKPLKENHTTQSITKNKVVYRGVNYTEEIKKHLEQAKSAIPLTIRERLQKYSFFTRCGGKILVNTKTVSNGKSKKRKSCRVGVNRRKPKSKVPQISIKQEEVPIFPESTLEQNIVFETQKTPISADLFEENCEVEAKISGGSGISAQTGNSQTVGPAKPFDKEGVLAMIKDFVNTKLYQEHMKLTGRDLFEDTKRRQERRKNKELQKERMYFDVEYEVPSEISSSECSSGYASPKSEYVYRSQPDLSKNISPVPHVVLKRNSHVEDLLQKALVKKAKIN